MKIEVITHSNKVRVLEVEEYNPVSLNAEISNHENGHTIVIGNRIFSKIDIKEIGLYEEDEEK